MAVKELAVLQARHDFLENEVKRLNTTEGKEQDIRQNFQVAKDGEQLVVIMNSTSTVHVNVEEESTMKKMWNRIKGIFH